MANRRVLLIGWDAADWKVIDRLMEEGKMPNIAGLVERGVMGNLATLYPSLSPMLWTSIATGKRPYKHGVWGFTEPDPATGTIRPVTNLSPTGNRSECHPPDRLLRRCRRQALQVARAARTPIR